MAATEAPCYTVIADLDDTATSEHTLRSNLEKGDISVKIGALKKAILLMMNGEKFPSLLMVIIRFVMPQDDHTLKKLLLLYWEIVPKTNAEGKLLHEMILVCDAYRKDLQHPNEFVRGSTLRFLCKLKEPELLEPLMPAIRECLSHRHSYVRRNAVLAIYTIYKNFDNLIPDAPELIQNLLEVEQDASCKRNAFMMLISVDQNRALDYLSTCIDQVQSFNEILQLVIVELVQKVCRTDVSQRSRFIRVVYNLLESSSAAVRYEAGGALVTLSSAPSAVSAAAGAYTELILKEADNNVKLIVLDRLAALKNNPQHERVMQNAVMDILRVVAASDLQVRKKTLDLCLELIVSRNVGEVVGFLKKELAKSTSGGFDKVDDYRQLLVRALHSIGVRFPEITATLVPQLMEYLVDTTDVNPRVLPPAVDVIVFVREAFERMPQLRSEMLSKLLEFFPSIRVPRVNRAALWIIGEYAVTAADIRSSLKHIRQALGPLPLVDTELRAAADAAAAAEAALAEGGPSAVKVVTKTRITADGTYATESTFVSTATTVVAEKPSLRKIMLDGDFYCATGVASCLTKMALRFEDLPDQDAQAKNSLRAEAMYILSCILHLGKSNIPTTKMDDDVRERVMFCLRVLADPTSPLKSNFLEDCQHVFQNMLKVTTEIEASQKTEKKSTVVVQADDLISFRTLKSKEAQVLEDQFELDLRQATGAGETKKDTSSKLSKVFQLSGFSDPVYAEAYVHVHQYDILLDVLVVNQTPDTLQNLTLELATLGDLKLTEKPATHTIGAHDFCSITAHVKVSSTETGIIFGNIVYDVAGAGTDRNVVVLNDIHIDIMDYIVPANCGDTEFRAMWVEFEWENKVVVRTSLTSLKAYVDHLIAVTNMRCLTPDVCLEGECDFFATNLYARSVFGEDALANVSIERNADGHISGHVRIRSKTQGIALSLGDKINLSQKAEN